MARALDLGSLLRLGRGEELTGGRRKASLLADAMEAVIAAVYLGSGGLAPVLCLVDRFLGDAFARAIGGHARSRLQDAAPGAVAEPAAGHAALPRGRRARPRSLEDVRGGNGPPRRGRSAAARADRRRTRNRPRRRSRSSCSCAGSPSRARSPRAERRRPLRPRLPERPQRARRRRSRRRERPRQTPVPARRARRLRGPRRASRPRARSPRPPPAHRSRALGWPRRRQAPPSRRASRHPRSEPARRPRSPAGSAPLARHLRRSRPARGRVAGSETRRRCRPRPLSICPLPLR